MNKTDEYINKLKQETNNNQDIIIREKIVLKKKIYIIYNETLTSSDKISDFIIRSLDKINNNYNKKDDLDTLIYNEIENYKNTQEKILELSNHKKHYIYLSLHFLFPRLFLR